MVFQREQRMTEIDWTRQARMRAKTAVALPRRDRIREALAAPEFELR
jgi:hypothetical protein